MLDKNILNLKSKYSLLYRTNVVLQVLRSYFSELLIQSRVDTGT